MTFKTGCGNRLGRPVLLLCIGYFFAGLVAAADGSEVGGQIEEHATWDLARSPVVLIEDIRVWNKSGSAGTVELKIEPGVEVNLNGFTITAGDQSDKDHPPHQGRILADNVHFFGKGNVVLACGEKNKISNCSFDHVHLRLGGKTTKNSSGEIRNITMRYADIIIYSGKWEVIGGKLLNGAISHQGLKIPGMSSQPEPYVNFFMNMISSP